MRTAEKLAEIRELCNVATAKTGIKYESVALYGENANDIVIKFNREGQEPLEIRLDWALNFIRNIVL